MGPVGQRHRRRRGVGDPLEERRRRRAQITQQPGGHRRRRRHDHRRRRQGGAAVDDDLVAAAGGPDRRHRLVGAQVDAERRQPGHERLDEFRHAGLERHERCPPRRDRSDRPRTRRAPRSLAAQQFRGAAGEGRPHEAAVVPFHVDEAGEGGGQAEAGGVAGVDPGQQRLDHPGVGLAAEAAGEELSHGLLRGSRPAPPVLLACPAAGEGDVGHQPGRPHRRQQSRAQQRPDPGRRAEDEALGELPQPAPRPHERAPVLGLRVHEPVAGQERVGPRLDDEPVDPGGGDLAPEPFAGLHQGDGSATFGQLQRRGQAGDAASHHDDRAGVIHATPGPGENCSSISAARVSARASEALSISIRSSRRPSFSARARNSMSMS